MTDPTKIDQLFEDKDFDTEVANRNNVAEFDDNGIFDIDDPAGVIIERDTEYSQVEPEDEAPHPAEGATSSKLPVIGTRRKKSGASAKIVLPSETTPEVKPKTKAAPKAKAPKPAKPVKEPKAPKPKAVKEPKPKKEPKAAKAPKVEVMPDYILPERYQIGDYESGVEILRGLLGASNMSNMELGWALWGVPTKYGAKTIANLARDLNVQASTLNVARWTMKWISPEEVALFPHVTFGHLKVAAKIGLTNREEGLDLLEKVESGEGNEDGSPWTIAQLTKYLRGEQPAKKKPLSLTAETFRITETEEGFTFEVFTADRGDWWKLAQAAGLFDGAIKVTFKTALED